MYSKLDTMIFIQLILIFTIVVLTLKYGLTLLAYLGIALLAAARFLNFIYTGSTPDGVTPHRYYKQYPWMRKTLAVVLSTNISLGLLSIFIYLF